MQSYYRVQSRMWSFRNRLRFYFWLAQTLWVFGLAAVNKLLNLGSVLISANCIIFTQEFKSTVDSLTATAGYCNRKHYKTLLVYLFNRHYVKFKRNRSSRIRVSQIFNSVQMFGLYCISRFSARLTNGLMLCFHSLRWSVYPIFITWDIASMIRAR